MKMKCRNCDGGGILERRYNCPKCGGTGEIEPEEGTYDWALKQLEAGLEVEGEWCSTFHDVELGHKPPGIYWTVTGSIIPPNSTNTFRLKPRAIVEWPRCCDDAKDMMLYFRSPDDHPFTSSEVEHRKDFVNFIIILPNEEVIKVDRDHVWGHPDARNWTPPCACGWDYFHETHMSGKIGFTQRIDASGVNMLKEVTDV